MLDHNLYSRRQTRALFISDLPTARKAVACGICHPSKEAGFLPGGAQSENKRKIRTMGQPDYSPDDDSERDKRDELPTLDGARMS